MNIVKPLFLPMLTLLMVSSCQNSTTEYGEIPKPENIKQRIQVEEEKTETPEQKAIRLAEEFIKRNGYTESPADPKNLSHETVEYYENIDELLAQRRGTLEPKAYGIFYRGRLGDDKGWTVVFQYSKKFTGNFEADSKLVSSPKLAGRAVTMNENFENLLVEHKNFFLDKVQKKLQ